MRVLLDLNVVLDLFLVRKPWCDDSAASGTRTASDRLMHTSRPPRSAHSFILCASTEGVRCAQRAVTDCLNSLTIVPVDVSSLRLAVMGPGGDFEDNLQVASAVEAKLDAIVTRDPKDFAGSPLPVLTPTEFLAKLPKAPDA